jgi:nucleotide-binding universal stress UspA family protein
MIKTVLVATDGSNHAKKAVSLAIDLASKYEARLIVVHALLRDATSETLRKLVTRKDLTKEQRTQLDNYEVDMQMSMAGTGMEAPIGPLPAPKEVLEFVGQQILDRTKALAENAGIEKLTTRLIGGDPAEGILEAATKGRASLVVLGTRGFGELKGWFVGSVSHKVAAEAPCPVLTVK